MIVAWLTDMYSYDEAYSLCGVISEQIKMLSGMSTVLIIDEAFPQSGTPWNDQVLRRIPGVPRSNQIKIDATWDEDIEKLRVAMEGVLADIDVVITHDLIYQNAQVKHAIAAKKVAVAHPEKRWLHWIHSATAGFSKQHMKVTGGGFPHSKIVFPNQYDRARVAQNYRVPESDVVFVPHSTDPIEFLMDHPLSKALAKDIDLLEADVIGCVPARLDRGKQVEIGIEIFAGIKQTGRSVRYIIFDFHSTGGDKVLYRKHLKKKCANLGLAVGREVVFLSEWSKETKVRSSRQMVADIMRIGDVMIQPSRSETYSLVVQEAALCKNLLLLNGDFPPIRSVYGEDALYGKFSSNLDILSGTDGTTDTKYNNRQDYMNDMARKIIGRLEESMVLKQFRFRRKYRNPQAVFRDYLEPLLWSLQ